MATGNTIADYHARQNPVDQEICDGLHGAITAALPEADSKVWHGHPVWFLDGNPIVGYHRLKDSLRLMFWSGQGFDEPGLAPEGKFKAAGVRYSDVAQIDTEKLRRWMANARTVQWDYKNIVKHKGLLEKQ